MVFGRIDIYWPDGRLESYIIDQPTVSIGRAEGNTIPLDTDTISRYHFSLVMDQGQMTITDLESVNGTFVDGVPLTSNAPRVLGDVEEIQVGALRIIWRQVDESPTLPIAPSTEEDTARIELDTVDFRLEFDTMVLHAWPAASASSELAVVNLAETNRRFAIRVSGMPGDWLRVNRPEVEIHPGETAYILINVKPPRRPNTAPNHYQLVVEVVPVEQPQMVLRGVLDVTVHPYSGFGMAVAAQRDIDEPVDVFLQNQGSGVVAMILNIVDPQQALLVDLPRAPLEIQPGQNLRVPLNIKAKRPPLTGSPREYSFIVQAKANNAAGFMVADMGKVLISPRFPMWQLVTAAGIALAVVLVGLLAVLGVLTPPNPTIEAVTVDRAEVMQGEPIILSWDGDDLERINISVNQRLVHENLPGNQTSVEIPTDNYAGTITIGLFGETGRLTTMAQINVVVGVPFSVESLTVSPLQIVRNVVSEVSVTWRVPDATVVRVGGLASFTNNLVSASMEHSAEDSVTGSGIPDGPLEVVLIAENADGERTEDRRIIPIIDPQCSALDDVPLREGPDERFQQIGTAPTGATVVMLAQHTTSGWLRVQLPGDITGWTERDQFECDGSFELSNLRAEDNVPELPQSTPPPPPPTQIPNS